MRRFLIAVLACAGLLAAPAYAQVSLNFGAPGVNIGLNLGAYPNLVPVPGYPVYYAPGVDGNYFYYDGLYWVLGGDGDWYESSWYNGPWQFVDPVNVPAFVLQVPVRYYHRPPAFFHGWRADAAPRWDQHWGRSWADRRGNWDHRDERAARDRAPLPSYQQRYARNNYPRGHDMSVIQAQNNHYQPRENISRQQFDYHRNEAARGQGREEQRRTPTTNRGQERIGGTGQDQRG